MHGAALRFPLAWLRPRWLLVGLTCFFLVIGVQYTLKLRHSKNNSRSAFLRWRIQLDDLDAGVNVWEKHAYPNPPIMAIILKPFHDLPPRLGASLWFAFKAILALAAILGVLRLLDANPPLAPMPLVGKVLAIALCLRPMAGDLVHGNVNLLILFLIVATLLALLHGRDGLAGLFLGLGIACKLTPALFLVYFLWKRAWGVLLGATASLGLFVLLIPASFLGWHENLEYLQSWHKQMIAPFAAGVVTSEHNNQSLPGFLHRMLTDEPSFSDYDGDRRISLETHNLASLPREAVQSILLGCMAIFVLLVMRFCPAGATDRPTLQTLAEFGVIVLGMLLFCERTWKHHAVTLLLPFAVLSYGVTTPTFSRGLRWYFAATLGLTAVLMLATSTGVFDRHLDPEERFGKLAQVYGAYVWVFLLLLASMFVVLRSLPRPNSESDRNCQHQPPAQVGG